MLLQFINLLSQILEIVTSYNLFENYLTFICTGESLGHVSETNQISGNCYFT